MSGITVAYSGVHQAYQLALAAEELGELERFYTSLFAAPGKWGGALKFILGADALHNRFVAGLPKDKVVENPWPLAAHRSRTQVGLAARDNWSKANTRFDHWVAGELAASRASLFVGVETCAAASFAAAHARGMINVLDCPGIDTELLNRLALAAAREFGLTTVADADSETIREMKARELQLADAIFTCSELQARRLREVTQPSNGIHVIPLWVDPKFWFPAKDMEAPRHGPLRVLYGGKINLRKGVPYLLRAAAQCGSKIDLTLVGNLHDEVKPLFSNDDKSPRILPPCGKTRLRRLYQQNDLLVLPSLGDAFGFVALEAMACGLPVIVSENCGVPVPDRSWRVPAMNSPAIAERLALYADDRQRCREHGSMALAFARQYSPEKYRRQVKKIFAQLLGQKSQHAPDAASLAAITNAPSAEYGATR